MDPKVPKRSWKGAENAHKGLVLCIQRSVLRAHRAGSPNQWHYVQCHMVCGTCSGVDHIFLHLCLHWTSPDRFTRLYRGSDIFNDQNVRPLKFKFLSFAMLTLTRPMNVIPTFLAILVNTKVSVDRIAQFLDEEEVPAFVSDLKEEPATAATNRPTERDERLGIKDGWFRWNQAVEPLEAEAAHKRWWKFWRKSETLPMVVKPVSSDLTTERNGTNGTSTPAELHRFELRDIDIVFPSGHLTILTGPTGRFHVLLLFPIAQCGPSIRKDGFTNGLARGDVTRGD
jgi:hypothetical protein